MQVQGWAQLNGWKKPSFATVFRPLSAMLLLAAFAGVYMTGAWWQRLLVAVYAVVAVYLFVTLMLYVVMRLGGSSAGGREVGSDEAGELATAVLAFGKGIGVDDGEWRFFDIGDQVLAACQMPGSGGTIVFLASRSVEEPAGMQYAFIGERGGQRFEVHADAVPMPAQGIDLYYDRTAGAERLFEMACELADSDAVMDIDRLGITEVVANPLKPLGGFFRLARTWGPICWRRRGVVRGFGELPPSSG